MLRKNIARNFAGKPKDRKDLIWSWLKNSNYCSVFDHYWARESGKHCRILLWLQSRQSLCNSPHIHRFMPVVNGVFNDIVINCPLVLNSSEWKGFRFCRSNQLTARIPERQNEKYYFFQSAKWDIFLNCLKNLCKYLRTQKWDKILFEVEFTLFWLDKEIPLHVENTTHPIKS